MSAVSRRTATRIGATLLAVLVTLAGSARATSPEDAFVLPPTPAHQESAYEVLRRAFDRFYGFDLARRAKLIVLMRDGREFRFDAQIVRKWIDGRPHQLFDFGGSSDQRDLAFLKITRDERSDDVFTWVPDLRRVRRITTIQRGDAFIGSDIAIEDLEVLRIQRFQVVGRSVTRYDGELAHVIGAEALYDSSYDRADFFVAASDWALLEVRLYRRNEREPFKVTYMPRSEIEQRDGYPLPRQIVFVNRERGTRAEFRFREQHVNPEMNRALFSKSALESERLRFMPSLKTTQDAAP